MKAPPPPLLSSFSENAFYLFNFMEAQNRETVLTNSAAFMEYIPSTRGLSFFSHKKLNRISSRALRSVRTSINDSDALVLARVLLVLGPRQWPVSSGAAGFSAICEQS